MTLTARLSRDLKANGPKTAVLGVLVLVGLYFWIPPLWRAVTGNAAAAEIPAVAAAAEPSPADPASSSPAAAAASLGWREAENRRAEDPLFRPAEGTDVRADAFAFDAGFLPIDVEFAEAESAEAVARVARNEPRSTHDAEGDGPSPLTLSSTLVGSGRRVAVINERVYTEGAVVAAAGRTWTVLNVEPRRVLLDGEGGTLELRIAPFAAGRNGP